MNVRTLLTSTFILLSFLYFQASADMIFESWDETVTLTEKGQKVEVKALARIELPENYQQTEWKYLFSSGSSIELIQAQVNGRAFKSFTGDQLTFDLGQLRNNDTAEISFSYFEQGKDFSPWFRQTWVQVPAFVSGAQSSMTVIIPDQLLICDAPFEFTKRGSMFFWKGTVPPSGMKGSFRTTTRTGLWKVVVTNTLQASSAFDELEVWYPHHFNVGGQFVPAYGLTQSPRADIISDRAPYHYMSFAHAGTNKVTTTITATVRTGEAMVPPAEEATHYLSLPAHEERKLKSFVQQVPGNTLGSNDARSIGRFVHDHMTYDSAYTGKTVGTLDIIEKRRGVCEHYAQLYVALCRAAGIPAVKVSGYAYDTEREWQEHAWALVYIKGAWTAMDPTWGLFEGVLPVSHITFYADDVHASRYVYKGTIDQVTSRTTAVIAPK